nr:hypothetical protein [Sphingomonas sp. LK11]
MALIGRSELPTLIRAIDGYDGDETPRRRAATRAALLFTLLTWARTNETRHARWEKFEDLDGPAPLWRVLAQRMKMALERDEVRGAITLRFIFLRVSACSRTDPGLSRAT